MNTEQSTEDRARIEAALKVAMDTQASLSVYSDPWVTAGKMGDALDKIIDILEANKPRRLTLEEAVRLAVAAYERECFDVLVCGENEHVLSMRAAAVAVLTAAHSRYTAWAMVKINELPITQWNGHATVRVDAVCHILDGGEPGPRRTS